jgi:miniconductance mechanosensitive channel
VFVAKIHKFTTDNANPYERLQAEVFDHLLAVLPEFGLRVFQIPSGLDVLSLSSH